MSSISQKIQAAQDLRQKEKKPTAGKIIRKFEGYKEKQPNFVARKGDFGDDARDFQQKDQQKWADELSRNPMYQGYR